MTRLYLDRWGDDVQARRMTKENRGSETSGVVCAGCPLSRDLVTLSVSHFTGLLTCVPESLLEFNTEKPSFLKKMETF